MGAAAQLWRHLISRGVNDIRSVEGHAGESWPSLAFWCISKISFRGFRMICFVTWGLLVWEGISFFLNFRWSWQWCT